jgi:hypothetical protein
MPSRPWDLYYFGEHIYTMSELEKLRNADYTPVSYLDQCVKIPSWEDVGIDLEKITEKYLETHTNE